ncbi:D-alanine--D-alanine ligase family protein [Erythrobacter sp. WG]|uniref:D-alanine--D-alanine ligase family protein n=1 Tax=Erythrobacter sp. WG TaxID=2985510 RepID=UPI002271ED0E|nr:phosphoribosylglycinamide synthetase [Erythrobacter sp. WG]MCX9146384.1 phosphoribosylglycinamide synthetase [Erythrobacter sp. WG]
MTQPIIPTRIPDEARQRLTTLFIAKHALGDGSLHPEDGNHAIYHHEVRTILEGLGIGLEVANSYDALFARPEGVDFVFPLLNRGGFLNSEMMLPLLCTRLGLPYVGASPILRGLSDDKHLSKLEAQARGVPTAPWAIFRRGAPVDVGIVPPAARWVIKPNASSASWGVQDACDAAGLEAAIASVHADGHDAIVEPFLVGSDVEVPVITIGGKPTILPMLQFLQADPAHLRTYYEKRDLVDRANKYSLVAYDRPEMVARIAAMTETLFGIFAPFDYGRFEFRVDDETGRIDFLEVNLNCNLWSEKVFGRAAILAGITQEELIETILAESMKRQGLFA